MSEFFFTARLQCGLRRITRAKHVAGAYKPSKYDILTGFLMRRILAKKDLTADPAEDKEYTDWIDLNAWINDWLNP